MHRWTSIEVGREQGARVEAGFLSLVFQLEPSLADKFSRGHEQHVCTLDKFSGGSIPKLDADQ